MIDFVSGLLLGIAIGLVACALAVVLLALRAANR